MARAVRFTSIQPLGPADPCALEPTPSTREWEEITAALESAPVIIMTDALLNGAHEIRGSYRGWMVYLYPNVRFYRNAPRGSGGNGYAGSPILGTKENVTLRMDGMTYTAEVEFV
jgi:hypothetical protein